jgi:deoxyribonucleoside regulator
MKNPRLMLKVAVLYYKEGLTHQEIAKKLNLSRQTVGRLLRTARESGVVQIRIVHPRSISLELEKQLENTFNLREAVVVPADSIFDEESLKAALGAAAADYLLGQVRSHDVLGISWGKTLAAVARYLTGSDTHDVKVVQLNGGLGRGRAITNASELVNRFCQAFNAEGYRLDVPAIVDNPQICQAIQSDSGIARTMELVSKANICTFSIGALSNVSVLVEAGYITTEDVQLLHSKGVVGDVCSRYIDINGKVADPDLDGRTIGIDIKDLRNKEFSIAIAGGLEKLDSIRGALAGGYCNVLVTDERVASALLGDSPAPPLREEILSWEDK